MEKKEKDVVVEEIVLEEGEGDRDQDEEDIALEEAEVDNNVEEEGVVRGGDEGGGDIDQVDEHDDPAIGTI